MDPPIYRISLHIQDQGKISLSPLSSLFTLKEEIRETFYPQCTSELLLFKQQQVLVDSGKTLLQYGIQDGDVLTVKPEVSGGDDNKVWFLWLIYYLMIPVFLLFLISGCLPIVSSGFQIILKLGLKWICSKTGILDKIPSWVKTVGSGFLWIIQTFFIFFFVWAICAYMMFPHLYGRQSRKCESGLAAKQIGRWCMFVFMIIYGLLNLPDILLSVLTNLTENTPLFVKAPIQPLISSLREVVDVSKFVPYYAMTGGILLMIHSGIESALSFIYMFLDDLSQFSCQDEASMRSMNSFLEMLIQLSDKSNPSKNHHPVVERIAQNRLKKKSQDSSYSFGLKTKDTEHNKSTEEQASMILQTNSASLVTQQAAKLMMANMTQYVKDFKLVPAFKLMNMGFTRRLVSKDQYPDWMKQESALTGWFSDQAVSFGCEILEAQGSIRDILYSIGTEFQVANMIKTGNIAGMVTSFVWLILFILTWFKSCIANQCYG